MLSRWRRLPASSTNRKAAVTMLSDSTLPTLTMPPASATRQPAAKRLLRQFSQRFTTASSRKAAPAANSSRKPKEPWSS